MADDDARRVRAEARRERATIRKARLQPVEADLTPIAGPDAISLVTRLTLESWSLSGAALPEYRREDIPVRFVLGCRG